MSERRHMTSCSNSDWSCVHWRSQNLFLFFFFFSFLIKIKNILVPLNCLRNSFLKERISRTNSWTGKRLRTAFQAWYLQSIGCQARGVIIRAIFSSCHCRGHWGVGRGGRGYWVVKDTRFSQPCKAADCKTRSVDPTEHFTRVPKFDYLKFISTTFRYKSSLQCDDWLVEVTNAQRERDAGILGIEILF